MKRDPESRYFFLVDNGEVVTITFSASNVPETPIDDRDRVHIVEGENVLKKTANKAQRTIECSFTINRPQHKSHVVLFECVLFSTTDPKNAQYKIAVTSESNGVASGPFSVPAANRLLPSGEIWFTVR